MSAQFLNDRYEVLSKLAEQYKKDAKWEDYVILHTRAMLAAKYLQRSE